jgi:malate synthase
MFRDVVVVVLNKKSANFELQRWCFRISLAPSYLRKMNMNPHLEIQENSKHIEGADYILSSAALQFIEQLQRRFNPRRIELLEARQKRVEQQRKGVNFDFLSETQAQRDAEWNIAPLPKDLLCRRVEITGPAERKMLINALNSGADSFMCDLEDANAPTWQNQVQGHKNLFDAVRRTICMTQNSKHYQLNEKTATLLVRPRGWHMVEKNFLIDGSPCSASLFDFGLYFFNNAQALIAQGAGPYFYLPKLESHLEARLWNEVFVYAQQALGIAQGSIKATVLIETLPAAFEMDEILYELREHSAGLNAGRWDYIFSCIKNFQHDANFCLADRAKLTMTSPFMRAYALLLLKTCHYRNAPAIGGMSALIPIKNDPEKNALAMAGVASDKARDAADGYDGGWVAHPGLVDLAMTEFKQVLGDAPNQIKKQRNDVHVLAKDLLNFHPQEPITESGLRMNIHVAIHYLGAWLAGNGCVPIHNLMEDAATAEISRSQVWHWIRSDKGVLDDGRKINLELVRAWIPEELEKVQLVVGSGPTYPQAASLFASMCEQEVLIDFVTKPLYSYL